MASSTDVINASRGYEPVGSCEGTSLAGESHPRLAAASWPRELGIESGAGLPRYRRGRRQLCSQARCAPPDAESGREGEGEAGRSGIA